MTAKLFYTRKNKFHSFNACNVKSSTLKTQLASSNESISGSIYFGDFSTCKCVKASPS